MLNSPRDTIFISHATPEDNDFSIWLASRLQAIGYKVWIDKSRLVGGERFWEKIGKVIRNDTCQYLLVYSNSICVNGEPDSLKDGIYKEYSLAETVGKENKIEDFILLLNIDANASFSMFIGSDRLNHIIFHDNWANGFKTLALKLEKQGVPRDDTLSGMDMAQWYQADYLSKNVVTHGIREMYHTSWWVVESMPKQFYIHKYTNEAQAKAVIELIGDYPYVVNGNSVVSFCKSIPTIVLRDGEEIEIRPVNVIECATRTSMIESEQRRLNLENHMKKLFNRTFHLLMKQNSLFWHELSNHKNVYFYPASKKGRIRFTYDASNGVRHKTKSVYGRYLNMGRWHYAVSARFITNPVCAFSLKSHIVFTENGYQVWADKKQMHTHRRKKGRLMFNEAWRDLLLAFINGLGDDDGHIRIQISETKVMSMCKTTVTAISNYGYYEPVTIDRQRILQDDRDDFMDAEAGEEV